MESRSQLQKTCRQYVREWRRIRRRWASRDAQASDVPPHAQVPAEYDTHLLRDRSLVSGFRGVTCYRPNPGVPPDLPSGRYRYAASVRHGRPDSIERKSVEFGPIRATPWEAAVDAMAILDRLRSEPSSIALWYYLRIGDHPQNITHSKYLRRLHGGLGTAALEVRREAVIRMLAASDGPLLGEAVAEATGLSRFQVRRVLDTLVMEGVATYARRKGYRLTARSDQKTG